MSQSHVLKMHDVETFLAQAYRDDIPTMSQNNPNNIRVIMDTLELYG